MDNPRSRAVERPISGDELLAMGDIGPCELVDGRIVPMTPTGGEHGSIESRLTGELLTFTRLRSVGWVLGGEVGIYTKRDPDRVRGADVAVVSKTRLPDGPGKGFLEVAPELVVEILSPEDRWQDLRQKIVEYFAIGVDRVWIVEPENRSVLVFTPPTDSRQLTEGDDLEGEGPLGGFFNPRRTSLRGLAAGLVAANTNHCADSSLDGPDDMAVISRTYACVKFINLTTSPSARSNRLVLAASIRVVGVAVAFRAILAPDRAGG